MLEFIKKLSLVMMEEKDRSRKSFNTLADEMEMSSLTLYRLTMGEQYNYLLGSIIKALDYFGYKLEIVKKDE